MQNFEKLGLFYLGKVYDHLAGKLTDEYLTYDSKDLVTHAVCVGMTGSGKTGLCIGILEEAAIDNIPAIIIDPKGDLGNLLLTFPDLRGKDFLPWVNTDEAAKKDLSPEAFAEKQANLWKNGLADWGQDGERIRKLKDAADFAIYTPGSSAGLPVSIMQSFAAPGKAVLADYDLFGDRIQATVSGILQLLGIKADPLQSREHILLSNIIEQTWRAGEDLDLGRLIQMIQSPPMQQIGVFDLESFYPASDRFKLAMTLNNLLAAPGFKTWMEGEPLDIDRMFYTESGKPRISIFSIAHLSDAERMFFVTLLLGQMLSWMRSQSGTTSLRALLYMDEVFGFLPPIGEPPSKKPLLTLLKQARAFGLGVVLSTQNPVDLDYKGLSNTGTWFIGRLQTERDQDRLIDGLSSAGGKGLDKRTLKNLISGLKKRVFLLHNVHEKAPVLFNTRWVLSYLRGPLTRSQIKALMADRRQTAASALAKDEKTAVENVPSHGKTSARPQLPPEIRQYFAPVKLFVPDDAAVVYHPYLIAGGDVQIINNRYKVMQSQTVAHTLDLSQRVVGLSWENSEAIALEPEIFQGEPVDDAAYLPIASEAKKLSKYNQLDKQYEGYLYRNFSLTLWKSSLFKQISAPGETEREFRIRLQQAARERRDLEVDRLRRKYARRMKTLERQQLTAQQRLGKESSDYQQKKMDTAISFGTTLLGMFMGGSRTRSGITRAARSTSRMSKEKQDIARAQEKLAQIEAQIRALEEELQAEIDMIAEKYDPELEELQSILIRPRKSDILQRYFGILWIPYLHSSDGSGQTESLYRN